MSLPLLTNLATRVREHHTHRVLERTRQRLATQTNLVLAATDLIEAIKELESAKATYHYMKEADHD